MTDAALHLIARKPDPLATRRAGVPTLHPQAAVTREHLLGGL